MRCRKTVGQACGRTTRGIRTEGAFKKTAFVTIVCNEGGFSRQESGTSGPFSVKTGRFSPVSDYLSIGKSPVIQNISRANPIIPISRSKGIPISNSSFTRARVQEA